MFDEIPRIMSRGFCEVCKKDCSVLTIGNTDYDDGHAIGVCWYCCMDLWSAEGGGNVLRGTGVGVPEPAKRYRLFAAPKFYPRGGWKDYKSESNNKQELMDLFNKNCQEDEFEWSTGHILDWDLKQIIIEVWSDRSYPKGQESKLKIEWTTEFL